MNSFLAQISPTDTNINVALDNPQGLSIEVNSILICNTTAVATTFDIYSDKTNIDSKTYDESNAIFFEATIEANQTIHVNGDNLIILDDASCSIAVKVGTASAITFSFFGETTQTTTSTTTA